MTFDTEQQRQVILQLIEASNIPGTALDAAFALKTAVLSASVGEAKADEKV